MVAQDRIREGPIQQPIHPIQYPRQKYRELRAGHCGRHAAGNVRERQHKRCGRNPEHRLTLPPTSHVQATAYKFLDIDATNGVGETPSTHSMAFSPDIITFRHDDFMVCVWVATYATVDFCLGHGVKQ